MPGQTPAATEGAAQAISFHGKAALLLATALALLATPLISPAMNDIAIAFAGDTPSDPVARVVAAFMTLFSDAVSISFIVKFISLSVPALFILLFSPIAGWLSDRWGRRRLLVASLLLFGVAGASGYFAASLTVLLLGRIGLGIAVAGIKTLTVAMVGDYFSGTARNRFIGWQGAAMKVGGVVFLFLGGALANIGWRVPFLGYLLAFIALPGVVFSLSESVPAPGHRQGAPAAATLALAPITFILVSAFVASVMFFMTMVQMPFFIPERFAGTPGEVGLATGLANLAAALIAMTFHRFKARLSYPGIFAFIFATMGAGYALAAFAPDFPVLLAAMLIAGCGFGLIVPAQSAWMMATVAPAQRGLGIGLVTAAMFLGQFAAPMAIEPFIAPDDPGHVFVLAAQMLAALAVLYAAIAAGGWCLARSQP